MEGSDTPTRFKPVVHNTGSEHTLVVREPEVFCIIGSPDFKDTVALSYSQECGGSSAQFQETQDYVEETSGIAISGDEETKVSCDKICEDFGQCVSLDHKKKKTFSKYSTFPCSAEVQSCTNSINEKNDSLFAGVDDQSLPESRGPSYARSMSLPASIKLVSAMKGARERNGESPKINLQVKWTAEVYDPPVTSVSHSVRRLPQRSKAKKKGKGCSKHKQSKDKSLRGASNERKNIQHRPIGNITNPADGRLQASADRPLLDKHSCSDAEIVDYMADGQEGKCGNNILKESLAKLHMPVC